MPCRSLSPGGVLLALAIATSPAGGATSGIYRGATSQRLRISIAVRGGQVREVHVRVHDDCPRASHPIDIGGGHFRIARDGRFSISIGEPATGLKVAGRFRGARAAGTLRETSAKTLGSPDVCDTGRVRFSVRRHRGR